MENTYNLIPKGKANAIKRTELKDRLGTSDREVRRNIERLQLSGHPIVNMQNGEGYFIADSYLDLLQYVKQEQSRIDIQQLKIKNMLERWKTDYENSRTT